MSRVRKDPRGNPLHDWNIVTLDQLSDEARQLIGKMARVAARDHYEEIRETLWEALSVELGKRVADAVRGLQVGPQDAPETPLIGSCMLCGQHRSGNQPVIRVGNTWAHNIATDCRRPAVPEQSRENAE